MKKNRIVVGAVLTAGLGLSGVVAASSSGAATPDSGAAARPATAHVLAQKAKPGKGPVVVCAFVRGPAGAKPGKPGAGLPGTGLPGTALPLPKPGQKPEKITIKVVNGKVYVNGKEVPGAKLNKDCPKPPKLPPLKNGKGGRVVIVTRGAGGKGAGTVDVQGAPGVKDAGGLTVQGEPGGQEAGLSTSALAG